jgi:hemoglobin
MKYASVDTRSIEVLVHHFYDQIRTDTYIGPVFDEVIGENWDRHLAIMVTFCSSVMLTSGLYKGTPMAKHMALRNIEPAHFDRWLALFRQSATELFEPEIAEAFTVRAERIAESFKLGLFYRPQEFKVVNAPLPS